MTAAAHTAHTADSLASDFYARGGARWLSARQVAYLFSLARRTDQTARNPMTGHVEASGDLLDAQGEVSGSWVVARMPNGAGALQVTLRPTSDALVARRAELRGILASTDEMLALAERETPVLLLLRERVQRELDGLQ